MKIVVIGCGYVGLVSSVCLATLGNTVESVDSDEDKVRQLSSGETTIYEPGLAGFLAENLRVERLNFSTDLRSVLAKCPPVVFIAVGTPEGQLGHADLSYVYSVAESLGKNLIHHAVIVIKSTVPVGTFEEVRNIIQEGLDKRNIFIQFDVVSNPEFLREGKAISDFMQPDRIILGGTPAAVKTIKLLYSHLNAPIIVMDNASAEMTKLAANAMLATRISFINEVAHLCGLSGADIRKVRLGIGSDSRIGSSFLEPGCGYGGSCFPKDVRALTAMSTEYGYAAPLLAAVEEVNFLQKIRMVSKITKTFGDDLSGITLAVWGLSFKPDTDDTRESPALYIANTLAALGASVLTYDPQATGVTTGRTGLYGNLHREPSKLPTLLNADALLVLTPWQEFCSPDFDEIRRLLKTPRIFDGRNIYDGPHLERLGFSYHSM